MISRFAFPGLGDHGMCIGDASVPAVDGKNSTAMVVAIIGNYRHRVGRSNHKPLDHLHLRPDQAALHWLRFWAEQVRATSGQHARGRRSSASPFGRPRNPRQVLISVPTLTGADMPYKCNPAPTPSCDMHIHIWRRYLGA